MDITEKMPTGMDKEKLMSNEPIAELEGKNVAIVAMGQSQIDFHLITNTQRRI